MNPPHNQHIFPMAIIKHNDWMCVLGSYLDVRYGAIPASVFGIILSSMIGCGRRVWVKGRDRVDRAGAEWIRLEQGVRVQVRKGKDAERIDAEGIDPG